MGWSLNQPQNSDPPSQLPATPSNNDPIIKNFFEGSPDKNIPIAKIKNVNNNALFGWNLTHGACKNIGKTTKKDDQNLNVFAFVR